MSTTHSSFDVQQRSTLTMQRSRGAASSVLLVLLGAWGAIIPFVGPYFHYTFGVPVPWFFTFDRLWLDVLPGIAVIVGGLILGPSANRASGGLGAWLALIGGIWFTTGPVISQLWRIGGLEAPIGPPLGANSMPLLEQLGYFYGLGTLITALAAFALGRLTVRSVHD
ncbi:MAG: hypothetical protein ACRDR6_15615 [Pseudonocardiaceae bacterium]